MDLRKYNIYFHTHTISGIIICALLYVIFFAGSFSFFKDEISAWQNNVSNVTVEEGVKQDFNHVFDSLAQLHELKGRDFGFFVQRNQQAVYVEMSASQDTTIAIANQETSNGRKRGRGNGDGAYFKYDFQSKAPSTYVESYDLGEFLYRLHFLAQLNQIGINIGTPFGYLLAGIVSFLFLFALITGLFLHWDKIKSNFFVFRPFSKWKTVWTDAHTALGVIGFPFQFVFAVTGIVLIVNFVLITPYSKILYDNDSEQLYQDLEFAELDDYPYQHKELPFNFDLNQLLEKTTKDWAPTQLAQIEIKNYKDENMHVLIETTADSKHNFAGSGKLIYRVKDQKILFQKAPNTESSYIDYVKALIYHLHFGDFGGKPIKIIFFVLGIMGCVVIISGILIWLVAREKPNLPARKRKFNFWLANIFLASCLTMLPVTALTFIAVKILPAATQTDIYHWYFYSWLVLGLYFILRRDIALTNRQTLLLNGILCLGVPIANGLYGQSWMWRTYHARAMDILFIDVLFLVLSILSFIIYYKIRNRKYPTKTVVVKV